MGDRSAPSSPLPENLPPIGLTRHQAAAFCGLTVRRFDRAVRRGQLPDGEWFGTQKLWHVELLKRRFDELFNFPSEAARDNEALRRVRDWRAKREAERAARLERRGRKVTE